MRVVTHLPAPCHAALALALTLGWGSTGAGAAEQRASYSPNVDDDFPTLLLWETPICTPICLPMRRAWAIAA